MDPDYDKALDDLGWDTPRFKASDPSPAAKIERAQRIRGEAYRRQDTGTFGAFTDAELNEASALAARDLRPDPVEAILGHPADHVEGDRSDDLKTFTIQFKVDIAPFVDKYRDLVALWDRNAADLRRTLSTPMVRLVGGPRDGDYVAVQKGRPLRVPIMQPISMLKADDLVPQTIDCSYGDYLPTKDPGIYRWQGPETFAVHLRGQPISPRLRRQSRRDRVASRLPDAVLARPR